MMVRASASAVRAGLATVVIATMAACGGGSTPSGPSTQQVVAPAANARATLTLKFPPHFAHASRGSTSSDRSAAGSRRPSYINPTVGYTLVIQNSGTAIMDPANPTNAYFTLGTPNADGTSTLTVPFSSGTYAAGTIQITEYDGLGTGNVLAFGSNQPYTNPDNSYNNGSLTVAPGGSAQLTVTMVMNATQVAITADPTTGTNSFALSGSSYTNYCALYGSTIFAFAADPSSGFVIPGTASGYAGGDGYNPYPGVPAVTLSQQSSSGNGTSRLVSTPPLGYSMQFDANNDPISATFFLVNPLAQIGNPYNPPPYIYGYAFILPSSSCG